MLKGETATTPIKTTRAMTIITFDHVFVKYNRHTTQLADEVYLRRERLLIISPKN